MRKLTVLIAVLVLIWGGYWFAGSSAVERGGAAALAELETEGWGVSYASLTTRGFPYRFDTTVTEIALTDPVSGIGWQAPFFQLLALSYQPNKVIAIWPEQQTITLPGQTLTLNSIGMRASAAVSASPALPMDQLTAEFRDATLASTSGWSATLANALAAFRAHPTTANTYDGYLDLGGLVLPVALRSLVDPEGTLPSAIALARIDLTLTLDSPLDRHLSAGPAPLVDRIDLRDLDVTWGPLRLTGSGEIIVDANGLPIGQIDLSVADWRRLIQLATSAGLIDPGVAPTWENAGNLMAGGSEILQQPLIFRDGRMFFGPLPLGPAPQLR